MTAPSCASSTTAWASTSELAARASSICSFRAVRRSTAPREGSGSGSRWCASWSSCRAAACARTATALARAARSRSSSRAPRAAVLGRPTRVSEARVRRSGFCWSTTNEDTRVMLRAYFELRKHEVHEAKNGPRGRGGCDAHQTGARPRGSRLPRLRRPRGRAPPASRSGGRATLLLVAVTGYGQPEDRERTASVGFEAHLVKPVCRISFEELLTRAVRGPEATGSRRKAESPERRAVPRALTPGASSPDGGSGL